MTKRSLALQADPRSVGEARLWVAEVLEDIDRPDLVPTAKLGVSELVTNALLHAEAPLTVRVRGTQQHPRIEVVDHSPEPLSPSRLSYLRDPVPDPTSEELPASYGRGLAIVAMNSSHWGSELDADGTGKSVWFEPDVETQEDRDLLEMFRSFEDETYREPLEPVPGAVSVELLNLPVDLFGQMRRYHFEVRREMRLLALCDPEHYPLAVSITDIFHEADANRRLTAGTGRLERAVEAGQANVDLRYDVPPQTPKTMARALELAGQVYQVFADEHLLELVPPPGVRAVQAWYFQEFVRQADGHSPIRWDPSLMDELALVR